MDRNEQEHITSGVHWQLQSITLGRMHMPVTRWYSPDFRTPGGFLWLIQKMSEDSTDGLMTAISKAAFQEFVAFYGFEEDDLPNASQAEVIPSISPLLDPHFAAFTNLQAESRQILNVWMQHTLAGWGQRHPAKRFQHEDNLAQLVILFSPNGIYLSIVGTLETDQAEELTTIGVETAKTQDMTQAS